MKKLLAGLIAAAIAGGGALVWGQGEDLFERLDANKDGVIAADEVQGEEQQAKFEQLLRRGDKNGDKKLTKDELQAALKPAGEERAAEGAKDQPRPRREGAAPDRPRPDRQYLEQLFAQWDANKDGKLTADEVPEDRRERFQQALAEFDDDGDKALTKEQGPRVVMFLMQRGERPEGARPDQQYMERLFSQWDANEDGKLTADEVPEDRRERFQQALAEFDDDGDKALTKEQGPRVVMFLMQRGGPPGGRGPFGPGAMPMMAVIRALDGNGDGELSKEEIEGASKALAQLDKDGDGKLSREELFPGLPRDAFPGARPDRPFPGRPPEGRPDQPRPEGRPDALPGERRPAANAEQIRARLKEMDANGDGKISKEEAQGRIKEGFDDIDANSDGFIDEAEIRARLQRPEGRRPEGRRPDDRRPDGDRPAGRRPPAEDDQKAKDKE